MKDSKNTRLRKRVLSGDITINQLVTLSPEELANEQVRELAAQVRKESIQQTLKVKDENETTKKQEIELLYPQGYDPAQWQPGAKKKELSKVDLEERDEKAFISTKSLSDTTLMNDSLETLSETQAKATAIDRKDVGSKSKEFDLDTLLSQVQTNAVPTSIVGQKRTQDDDSAVIKKKTKLDTSAGSSYDFAYLSDDGENNEEVKPVSRPIIWEGTVEMPQVAKFTGACSQVAGIELDSEDWQYIMPKFMNIDGRIQPNRVVPYLEQQLHSSTKDLIVLDFQVQEDEEANFHSLFEYFFTKDRYAVIKPTLSPVKDMYLIPLKKDQPLPDFIGLVPHCHFPETRSRDSLVCVIVLVRSLLPVKPSSQMDSASVAAQDLALQLNASNPQIAKILSDLSSLGIPIVQS